MTDDFHFDTEIIIKLQHQRYHINEVPIPTYYGDEICYVNGLKYARDVVKAVRRYRQTCRSVAELSGIPGILRPLPDQDGAWIRATRTRSRWRAADQEILDIGCGEGLLAAELKKNGNRITGIDELPRAERESVLERYYSVDLDGGIGPVLRALDGKRFDCILLLDVLEHSAAAGEDIAGVPPGHPSRWGRDYIGAECGQHHRGLMLLLARFTYRDQGILDRTHLRFFTPKTARQFIESQGFVSSSRELR